MVYRGGCCWFWLTAAPFVAKLSGAVRARDVMVNQFVISSCYRLSVYQSGYSKLF
ncbi:hypothetical protein YK94_004733 [Salmonella enterica subsp. enterica]|uniref:Uncharacterized protein n=1 Tax=Salmonella enterica subsp. enterica serovar Cerro TaxID=340188 RepID=A0A730ES60_SALET|nr:hypothetical protein [Salmonella enterica subsp. enterica serovar Concord]HAE3754676.1 hypothetical protein [Salmonella enterica subsp. enterica serovar Cerro]